MRAPKRNKTYKVATRKVARVVFSAIKKIGPSKGVTLRKIYDFIRTEHPSLVSNIVRLNNTLEKALTFGAVSKKPGNRYVLGSLVKVFDSPINRKIGITEARHRGRKRKNRSKRRKKSRSSSRRK